MTRPAREVLDMHGPGRDGRWVRKYREIDRQADRSVERVVDAATGKVLRDVSEPLSHHRRAPASGKGVEHEPRRGNDQQRSHDGRD
jgi:hypothetical protein